MTSSGDSHLPCSTGDSWCFTQVKMRTFRYTWTINNFRACHESMNENVAVKSSVFSERNGSEDQWHLKLYPKGLYSQTSLSLFLHLDVCSQEVWAECEFSILTVTGEEKHTKKTADTFTQLANHGFSDFIGKSYLLDESNGLLPNGDLTIRCGISVLVDKVNLHGQLNQVPESCLSADMDQLLDSQSFSDVILIANGREFPAHKALLAARSPVFKAMFEHDMEERKQNRVDITDVDQVVLQEVLRFIYTGKADNLKEMAGKLLAAADKYALGRLKAMCEETLCSNISVENAADVLLLADRHSVEQLKVRTFCFIGERAAEVMETPAWKAMSTSSPQLILEAFRALVVSPGK